MDWNKVIVMLGQVAVLVVLGILVALGHDSTVTYGLMAVSGSLAGIGVVEKLKKG